MKLEKVIRRIFYLISNMNTAFCLVVVASFIGLNVEGELCTYGYGYNYYSGGSGYFYMYLPSYYCATGCCGDYGSPKCCSKDSDYYTWDTFTKTAGVLSLALWFVCFVVIAVYGGYKLQRRIRRRKIEVSIDASKIPEHITRRRLHDNTGDRRIKIVTLSEESLNENPLLMSQHQQIPNLPPVNHQQTKKIGI